MPCNSNYVTVSRDMDRAARLAEPHVQDGSATATIRRETFPPICSPPVPHPSSCTPRPLTGPSTPLTNLLPRNHLPTLTQINHPALQRTTLTL